MAIWVFLLTTMDMSTRHANPPYFSLVLPNPFLARECYHNLNTNPASASLTGNLRNSLAPRQLSLWELIPIISFEPSIITL